MRWRDIWRESERKIKMAVRVVERRRRWREGGRREESGGCGDMER